MKPGTLCPNCGSGAHARCCSWCGKIHEPKRLHYEHCSAECEKAAARANRISDDLEKEWSSS